MSILFNGTTQYGLVNDSASLDLDGNGFTAVIWARMGSNTGLQYLIDKDQSYQIYLQDGRLSCNIYNSGFQQGAVDFADRETSTTTMFMWTVVWNNSTGNMTFYVNQTFKKNVSLSTGTITSNSNNLYIASEHLVSYGNLEIGSVRLYDKPLYLWQIQSLFNSKDKAMVQEDRDLNMRLRLSGYAPSTTATVNTEDRSGNDNTCAWTNSPTYQEDYLSVV